VKTTADNSAVVLCPWKDGMSEMQEHIFDDACCIFEKKVNLKLSLSGPDSALVALTMLHCG